jgi:hypothetical protein
MMPNVYKLDGSTNVKMGTFCGQPALFIRPMFPKDPVNHSHEERHAWHMNDLAENEQVIVMNDGQDLGQLYMAMRQVSSHVGKLNGGNDISAHQHTQPSSCGKSKDQESPMSVDLVGWSWCSEPGIQMANREYKHGDERQSGTATQLIDGLLHITETNVRVVDPKLGRGCSTSTMIIDPPPEVAEQIFEGQTGRKPTEEDRVKEIFSFDNKHQHSTSVERNDFSEPEKVEAPCHHPDPTLSFDNHSDSSE